MTPPLLTHTSLLPPLPCLGFRPLLEDCDLNLKEVWSSSSLQNKDNKPCFSKAAPFVEVSRHANVVWRIQLLNWTAFLSALQCLYRPSAGCNFQRYKWIFVLLCSFCRRNVHYVARNSCHTDWCICGIIDRGSAWRCMLSFIPVDI